MQKIFFIVFNFITVFAVAQNDTAKMNGIFERITGHVKEFKLDTTQVPDDKITNKIIKLRRLRGGFNINEAIAYKQQEDKNNKGEVSPQIAAYLDEQFKTGKGKRWLDNAMIHIYRQHFTYNELKQLVRFYKTSAGKKMAEDFPLIMMKSLIAAQIIHDTLIAEQNTESVLKYKSRDFNNSISKRKQLANLSTAKLVNPPLTHTPVHAHSLLLFHSDRSYF
jgi:hypothetical protein